MKRIWILLIVCTAAVLLGKSNGSLLSGYRDLEEIQLIRTLGIDAEEDAVRVTAGTGLDLNGANSELVSQKGNSVADALFQMEYLYSGKRPYFKHIENIILDEKMAEEELRGVIDYVSRMPSMRLKTDVFILCGASAGEIMEESLQGKSSATDQLCAIRENETVIKGTAVSTCGEIYAAMEDRGCCTAQCVRFSEENEKMLVPSGIALLHEYKLDGIMGEEASAGAAILLGTTKMQMRTVAVRENSIDVQISIRNVSYTMEKREKEKILKICVDVAANVAQTDGQLDLTDGGDPRRISEAVCKLMERDTMAAVRETQRLGKDYLGILKKLSLTETASVHPDAWKDLKVEVSYTVKEVGSFDTAASPRGKGSEYGK